jgi:acyl carrier protein
VQDMIAAIADVIAENCDVERQDITADANVISDLGVDSLDFLDISFAIEKRFDVKLPVDDWVEKVDGKEAELDDFFTVKAIAAYVRQHSAAAA